MRCEAKQSRTANKSTPAPDIELKKNDIQLEKALISQHHSSHSFYDRNLIKQEYKWNVHFTPTDILGSLISRTKFQFSVLQFESIIYITYFYKCKTYYMGMGSDGFITVV